MFGTFGQPSTTNSTTFSFGQSETRRIQPNGASGTFFALESTQNTSNHLTFDQSNHCPLKIEAPNIQNPFGQDTRRISFGACPSQPTASFGHGTSFGQAPSQPTASFGNGTSFGQAPSQPTASFGHDTSFGQAPSQPTASFGHDTSFGQAPSQYTASFGNDTSFGQAPSQPTLHKHVALRPPEADVSTRVIQRPHYNYDNMSGEEYLLHNDIALTIDYCQKLQMELRAKMGSTNTL